jgi:hypothetical protein
MDYLRHSERISRMNRIRNERIRTKMGNEERHITEEQQLRWYGHIMWIYTSTPPYAFMA